MDERTPTSASSPFTVEPGVNVDVPLNVDNPKEVGADRVCNIVAGVAHLRHPAHRGGLRHRHELRLVNARGEFIGGAIAPGIIHRADALVSRAARLSRVEIVRPKDAIGRNTATNIQSGVVYGCAGLVDGLVERMRRELDGDVRVVATGGFAEQMREVCRACKRSMPTCGSRGCA